MSETINDPWFEFDVVQAGEVVATASSPDRVQALKEAMHYAMVYSQDGPCTIQNVTPEDWAAYEAALSA